MKYRKDFVTNSSSSSYVCEICGRTESGWDLGLNEAEMFECENGHVFCVDEALEKPSKEEMIKMILENEWNVRHDYRKNKDIITTEEELADMDDDELFENFIAEDGNYGVPERMCPICQFIEYSEEDLSAFLLKEYGVSRDEVFAEVKKLNKRRRKLYENEYITYVCQRYNLVPAELVAEWKEKFGTYAKFKAYIRD